MADDRPLESRRELENLRQRYQEHRRTIRHLLQTAPDERLAARYEATLTELQKSIDQLDRIDRDSAPSISHEVADPNETRSIRPVAAGAADAGLDTLAAKPKPAFEEAEFSTQTRTWNDPLVKDETERPEESRPSGPVMPWVIGFIILLAIALGIFMFWPDGEPTVDEQPVLEATLEETAIEEVPQPPAVLVIEPSTYDFGVVQKGTRSIHRFTVRNRTDQILPISIERSDCRCLWYDYPPQIPAGESIELAVTVDGARAEPGILTQTVVVSSELDPDARAEIDLTAEISQQ